MGRMIAIGMQIAPTASLSRLCGRPVVPASVTIAMPIDPKATGAVFASRHSADALKGEKPSPTSMVAAVATGVPNPAAPSRDPPNAKAISSACNLGSGVSLPIDP